MKARPWGTLGAFALSIGVTKQVLQNWFKKYEDFADAREHARSIQEEKLSKIGYESMTGKRKKVDTGMWSFWMKARFGWSEYGPNDEDNDVRLNIVLERGATRNEKDDTKTESGEPVKRT